MALARTNLNPDDQIRAMLVYDDQIAAGVGMEAAGQTVEDNLHSIISQINRLMSGTVTGNNWYQDTVAPSGLGDAGAQRGVNSLNSDLHLIERKRILKRVSMVGLNAGSGVTIASAGDQFVILSGTEIPSTTTAAVGAVTSLGTVVADANATFGTATLDEVAGANALQPKNLLILTDASTGDVVVRGDGRQIYGLLQSENATDGFTITGTTPDRVQISFVVHNSNNTDLELITSGDMDGIGFNYAFVRRDAFEACPEEAWLGDGFADTGVANATRQASYDNQGATPVDTTTNAILDVGAGLSWELGDAASAPLFTVSEDSGGGATDLAIGAAVDTYNNNAIDVNFDNGVTVDNGSNAINLGVTADQIDFTANGTLTASSASTVTVTADAASVSMTTTTSGNVVLNSASNVSSTAAGTTDIDGAGAVSINSTGGALNLGNDADANAINIGTGAAARTITVGNATGATALDLSSGTGAIAFSSTNADTDQLLTLTQTGTGGDTVEMFVGDSSPDARVTAPIGSLFIDTNGALWQNVDGATDWTQFDAAGATTLSQAVTAQAGTAFTAGAFDTQWGLSDGQALEIGDSTNVGILTVAAAAAGDSVTVDLAETAGGAILDVTDGTNSLFTVSALTGGDTIAMANIDSFTADAAGAISLDAGAASNFTVAGADLTLSTTTSGDVIVDAADGTTGGAVTVAAGDGSTIGGALTLSSGSGTGTGDAGDITVTAGASGATGGSAGNVTINGGDSNVSTTGEVFINTIDAGTGQAAGGIYLTTGGGDAAAGGNIELTTGQGFNGSDGGDIVIAAANGGGVGGIGGGISLTTGGGNTNPGGTLALSTGTTSSGDAGDITITGGNAVGSGLGGDITLAPGTGPGGASSLTFTNQASPGLSEEDAIFTVSNQGTGTGGGSSVDVFVVESDPSVVGITANVGSVAHRNDTGAGTTGELWLKTGAADTDWEIIITGTAGQETLQEAYEAGNTIVTDSTNGDFDVSGTEAISLDAQTASNFTVDGANLTLSTTGASGDVLVSSSGGGATGGEIDLTAGSGTTTGGAIDLNGGAGGATGAGGGVTVNAGAGGSTSGDGGALTLTGGGATDGAGGNASLFGGSPAGGDNTGGSVTVSAGVGQGLNNGGDANIAGGLAAGNGNGGDVLINAGDVGGTGSGGSITGTGGDSGGLGIGGSVTWTGGMGSGSGGGGFVTLTGGEAGVGGTGGFVTLQGGLGGATTGSGGTVQILGGDAQTAGQGGAVTITAGAAVGTDLAGDVDITAGAADAGGGGDITLTATDSAGNNVVGGSITAVTGAGDGTADGGAFSLTTGAGGATGAGGNVSITAGDGGATSGAGGFLLFTAGSGTTTGSGGEIIFEAGAAAGATTNGTIRFRTAAGAGVSEEDDIIQLANQGTGTGGGSAITQYVIESDPSSVGITANVGSVAYRNVGGSSTAGQMWLKTGNTDTDWTQLATGGAVTLEAAWANNTGVTTLLATNFTGEISDTETYLVQTETGNHSLLNLSAISGADEVTVGHTNEASVLRLQSGTGDTLMTSSGDVSSTSVNFTVLTTAAVDIDGGASALLRSSTGSTTVRAAGAGSDVTLETTNATTPGDINLTTASGTLAVGGAVNITTGDGGGATSGGAYVVTTGNGAGSADGGVINMTTGDGGATGNGGTMTLTGGAGGATSGQGGDIVIEGGAATTSGSGGFIILEAGAPAGGGAAGAIALRTAADAGVDEEDYVVRLFNQGTGTGGGSAIDMFVVESDPSVVGVAANVGSMAYRNVGGTNTTGEVWLKTGNTDTDWEQIDVGGVGSNLQSAYEAGNTIVTDSTNGDLDVSGTEAISLDAGAASNFTVAGANLTLSTTGTANTIVQSDDFAILASADVTGTGMGGSILITEGASELFPGFGFNSLPTDTNSAPVGMASGSTSGTGNSGGVNINTGVAAGSGTSGTVGIGSGQNTGTGNSGGLNMGTGNVVDGNSGNILMSTGGSTNAASGNISIFTSDSDTTGSISLTTGDGSGDAAGSITFLCGNASGDNFGAPLTGTAGNGSAGGSGGAVTWTTGDAATSGNGGPYTVNTGAGGSTGGSGGDATFNMGDAQAGDSLGGGFDVNCGAGAGNGAGGAVAIDTGAGGVTGNAGAMALSTGDGGATSGSGGNIILSAGNSPTSGSGGTISITAGSSSTSGSAGAVNIQSGGNAGGTAGIINLRNTASGHTEDNPVLLVQNSGTNGEAFNVFAGSSVPTVSALTGSLWVRDNASTGELYLNTSAGGSGTTWTQLQAGGGNSLQQAYVQGNTITTSATNGDLSFDGTEDFLVDMDGNITMTSAGTVLSIINDNQSGTGSAFFGTGTTTGGNASGDVTLQSGSGGSGSDSGTVNVTSGAITNGAGTTGALNLQSGNAIISATGSTGAVTLVSGTSTAASAGTVSINPGNSGAGNGAAATMNGGASSAGVGGNLNLGGGDGSTGGGNILMSGGDASGTGAAGNIQLDGGTPTDGNGGNIILQGSDGVGTNRDGGGILLSAGAPTGTGTAGIVSVESDNGLSDALFRLDRAGGTSGVTVDFYNGSVAPESNVTANQGDVYFRDGGASGDEVIYVKGTGDGTNTGWVGLQSASASVTRQHFQTTMAATVTPGNTITDADVTGTLPAKPSSGFSFDTDAEIYLNGVLLFNGTGNEVTSGTGDDIDVEATGPTFNTNDVITIIYYTNSTAG